MANLDTGCSWVCFWTFKGCIKVFSFCIHRRIWDYIDNSLDVRRQPKEYPIHLAPDSFHSTGSIHVDMDKLDFVYWKKTILRVDNRYHISAIQRNRWLGSHSPSLPNIASVFSK
jgi:hypothetical protein